MSKKINNNKINNINNLSVSKINSYFGNWFQDESYIENKKNEFVNNKPFSHCIIENFLSNDYCEALEKEFPTNIETKNTWYKYFNPLEIKYARDDIQNFNETLEKYFYLLSSNIFLEKIKKITNIKDLEIDDYLHGAGIHLHPKRGRLQMHLDYEKHPYSGKQRRINIIFFLNRDWNPEWNGQTELWDKEMKKCVKKVDIVFNRALIFKTNEISYHGLPEPINSPLNVYRKTIAYYYVSKLNNLSNIKKLGSNDEGYRTKATYVPRPCDTITSGLQMIYDIRPFRRITSKDLLKYIPEWDYQKN